MTPESRIVAPGPDLQTVRDSSGVLLKVPAGWDLLPPGDAGLTRRVKAAGPTWTVQEKRGRKLFSRGVYAPKQTIESIRIDLAQERSTESYAKRQASAARRRDEQQESYVEDFESAVVDFLNFHPRYDSVAKELAKRVTVHATPVGSGTVARTKRIPIEKRAEAAVIAWMRHQTTAYDNLKIARVRGMRREVRRSLAEESRTILEYYRRGLQVDATTCPLQKAVRES